MTDNNQKALSMIGLATKAGKLVSGEFSVEAAVRKGKAQMIIIAEDASANTKKSFQDMSTYYRVPLYIFGTKESLGRYTGKGIRTSIAILDPGFSATIRKLIQQ